MATISVERTQQGPSKSFSQVLRRWLWENSLSLALFGVFLFSLVGQIWTGLADYNDAQVQHGQATIALGSYLTTGHFIEAVFENWESEFLQMAAYVVFTISLRQKGSSESKRMEGSADSDADPRLSKHKDVAPWPVRRGGLVLKVYENSLTIAFALLFLLSFSLHAVGGSMEYNDDQAEHGSTERVSPVEYVTTARFWFESFQNWQSEFLSLGAMVVISIYLRQRGSPESKRVDAPFWETGSE